MCLTILSFRLTTFGNFCFVVFSSGVIFICFVSFLLMLFLLFLYSLMLFASATMKFRLVNDSRPIKHFLLSRVITSLFFYTVFFSTLTLTAVKPSRFSSRPLLSTYSLVVVWQIMYLSSIFFSNRSVLVLLLRTLSRSL